MVRKELGGYCPKDSLEFAFMSSVIASRNVTKSRGNKYSKLQNLINKSK